ncbi:MAG: hypothetical protein CVT99_04435 [Bacteroidetes bacterium HGW-Bacteroidetes-16]|jgi:hypothetical protein|nr:MAG: hypothetical protein CVT99_04435 [Bacteroidetes bacterium HGW-Bacteroidetes-16]
MRSKDDLCLICNLYKSDKTNSHFIPAGLLKSNIGERNYEEAYMIGVSEQAPITDYFGRSNLKNTDPEIKQNPHAADYIFCSKCEDKLAELENEFVPYLNSLKKKFAGKQDNVLVFGDLNTLRFKVFVYSLIYRLNLQSVLKNLLTGIDFHLFNKLRLIISNKFAGLDYLVDTSINFSVFASLNNEYDYSMNFVGINTFFINPLLMVNEFHIVPYIPPFPLINSSFESAFKHYQNLDGLTNKQVSIYNVETEKWLTVHEHLVNYQAYQFRTIRIGQLMRKTKQTFEECQQKLYNLAEKIHLETSKPFGISYDVAFKKLIE